jgi:hypothetical protein
MRSAHSSLSVQAAARASGYWNITPAAYPLPVVQAAARASGYWNNPAAESRALGVQAAARASGYWNHASGLLIASRVQAAARASGYWNFGRLPHPVPVFKPLREQAVTGTCGRTAPAWSYVQAAARASGYWNHQHYGQSVYDVQAAARASGYWNWIIEAFAVDAVQAAACLGGYSNSASCMRRISYCDGNRKSKTLAPISSGRTSTSAVAPSVLRSTAPARGRVRARRAPRRRPPWPSSATRRDAEQRPARRLPRGSAGAGAGSSHDHAAGRAAAVVVDDVEPMCDVGVSVNPCSAARVRTWRAARARVPAAAARSHVPRRHRARRASAGRTAPTVRCWGGGGRCAWIAAAVPDETVIIAPSAQVAGEPLAVGGTGT